VSRNISTLDRGLRSFVIAPAAIVIAFVVGAGSVAGIVLFVLAAVMLATSAVGFCPGVPAAPPRRSRPKPASPLT